MEELSIEEKAKRYDELLLKLQKAKVDDNVCDEMYYRVIDNIVPELKESEDEKIRKALICGMYTIKEQYKTCFASIPIDNVIAWLEKQGEQDSYNGVSFKYNGHTWGMCARDNGVDILLDRQLIKHLEKQGKQEEPQVYKTKDGEIIAYSETDGYKLVGPKFKIGDTMRTLQEASNGITSGLPVVVSIDNEYYHCNNELIAIKDQDDYEYPPMNRRQKPVDNVEPFDKYEGLTDFERTLADICLGWISEEESGWKQYIKDNADVLLKIAVKKFNSVQEQKPAWSEEDEVRITHLISLVEHHHNKDYDYFDYSDLAKWLKSLKGGVQSQPKQEWSVEDEKKRNLLIDILNVNHPNGCFKVNPINTPNMEAISTEELVSWLKTLRPQNTWKPSDEQKPQGNSALEATNEEKVDNANKVKHKFNEGDWVVNRENKIGQIKALKKDKYNVLRYCIEWKDGKKTNPIQYYTDNYCHLWTLSDVKNGDILYSPSHHLIWIYKDNKEVHVGINMNYPLSLSVNTGLVIPNDACLATKEQRDTLEKAMADAGYTFDFEKKELKRIEQKSVEWSEEDEKMLSDIIEFGAHDRLTPNDISWLNSLRNRVQPKPKQEWSEEDKNLLKISVENLTELKDRFGKDYGKVGDCISWLKSLKQRCIWKPSDEQMIALNDAILLNEEENYNGAVLSTLREQLKKLK